jgi:hypothetical protein
MKFTDKTAVLDNFLLDNVSLNGLVTLQRRIMHLRIDYLTYFTLFPWQPEM